MTRYYIESVRSGASEGGMACGPVSDVVVTEAKVRTEEGKEFFIAYADVCGMPHFAQDEKSLYSVMTMEDDSEEEIERMNRNCVAYDSSMDFYCEAEDSEEYRLKKYIMCINNLSQEEAEALINATQGKWLDQIEIPVTDEERDAIEDMEMYE